MATVGHCAQYCIIVDALRTTTATTPTAATTTNTTTTTTSSTTTTIITSTARGLGGISRGGFSTFLLVAAAAYTPSCRTRSRSPRTYSRCVFADLPRTRYQDSPFFRVNFFFIYFLGSFPLNLYKKCQVNKSKISLCQFKLEI